MANEVEIIRYPKINNVNIFIVAMEYRTPHLHRDFEIDFIMEGNLTLVCNNERYMCGTGDFLLLNPNQSHEIFTHGEVGATILCIQVSPRFFRDTLSVMSDVFFEKVKFGASEGEWQTKIAKIFVNSAIAYVDSDLSSQLLCASKLNKIFYLLLQAVPHHYLSFVEQQDLQYKAKRILRLIDFVDANFMHKINLQDFAEAEGVSLNHMSYFIKSNLNQTFQEYVTNVRFNHARKLLFADNKRLIDICLESGFSDPRYLTKAFMQKTGLRPNEYRRKYTRQKTEEQYQISLHSSQKFYSDEEAVRILSYVNTSLWN